MPAAAATSFKPFAVAVAARWEEMSKGELFVVDSSDLDERYLAAFPPGTDPMFRTKTEHDCRCCRNFVKRLGGCVSINDGKLTTLWGDLDLPEPYKHVADVLDIYVRGSRVVSVFRINERAYGKEHNYDPKTNERYEHFHGQIALRHFSATPESDRHPLVFNWIIE